MTTNLEALEVTIASDPVLADPQFSATLKLARDLASELDSQIASTGAGQSKTIATYAGLLGSLRRIIRDDRAARAKSGTTAKQASRLSLIKQQAQTGKAAS